MTGGRLMSDKVGIKDSENLDLIEELEIREAGVKELFGFYAGVETVYIASMRRWRKEALA